MFSRFIALLPLAALAAVVAATPSNECDTGSVFCCNQEFANPSEFKKVLNSEGVVQALLGLGVNAGVQCSPVTVIGAFSDGGKCLKQTVCCENVKQVGLVNAGCTPIAAAV